MFEVHLHHALGIVDVCPCQNREDADLVYTKAREHMASCPLHPRLELFDPDGMLLRSDTPESVQMIA